MTISTVLKSGALAVALAFSASAAQAAPIHFTGNLSAHNEVVYVNFTLDNPGTNVRVWTDSYQNFTNFDPITALWNATTGALIAQNDDNSSINPATQTRFDSGFILSTLAAGNYVFSMTTFANFANSAGTLSNPGFAYAGQTPIALIGWNEPSNGTVRGTAWSIWVDGADRATGPAPSNVPVPASALLMGLGLLGAFAASRKAKV